MRDLPKQNSQIQKIRQQEASNLVNSPVQKPSNTAISESSSETKLIHLNTQSLANKISHFEVFLNNLGGSDLVCVTETWFKANLLSFYNIDGYTMVESYCRTQARGGGVAIYSRTGLKVDPVHSRVQPIEMHFEFACVRAQYFKQAYVIVVVYRSPLGNINLFIENLSELLEELFKSSITMIVCGDFNIDFAKMSRERDELCDLLLSYGLVSHVTSATRKISNTRIDNVFTNLGNYFIRCDIIESGLSDHSAQLLYFKSDIITVRPLIKEVRIFNYETISHFKNCLRNETWQEVLLQADVNCKYDCFVNIFRYYFDVCFPLQFRRITNRSKSSWISAELKEWSNDIRDLHKLYKVTKDANVLGRYKSERHNFRKCLADYRMTMNESYIVNSANKSKAVWDIFNDITKKGNKPKKLEISHHNSKVIDPKAIANLFAENFKLSTVAASYKPYDITNRIDRSIYLYPTDATEVAQAIITTQNKKSMGLDGIPPDIVGQVSEHILEPLTDILNAMFTTGIFPDNAKKAKCLPLHKSGRTDLVENYRMISILPAFSKIFERIIYSRIIRFIEKYNILSPAQYGFVENRSVENAIFDAVTNILGYIDKQKKVEGIYFDLSKAFDRVNHNVLLIKLEEIGIRGKANDLVSSFLTNRRQYVYINNNFNGKLEVSYSDEVMVSGGVPQGSILGPLLFIVYVNDLKVRLGRESLYQFADDTSCIVVADTVRDLSTQTCIVINKMMEWCDSNGLKLNENKTKLIHYAASVKDFSLYVPVNGRSLHEVNDLKFLGIVHDQTLSWVLHIDALNNKLNTACCVLRYIRSQLTVDCLRIFYFAYVQSRLSYGISFWYSTSYGSKIFINQKRIIRTILRLGNRTSCRQYFRMLNIMTVPSLYVYKLVMYVRSNSDSFVRNEDCYNELNICTRNRTDLRIPEYRLAKSQKGPYYCAVKAYNALPSDIKSIRSSFAFKSQLKKYLIDKSFYSFSEYLGISSV